MPFAPPAASDTCVPTLAALTPPQPVAPARHFEPDRTVLLGDSQAQGLKNAGALTDAGVRAYGHTGQTIGYVRSRVRDDAALRRSLRNAELVYLQIGGNNVSRGDKAASIVADLEALVSDVRALNPTAEIVVGEIPVRGAWFDRVHGRGTDPRETTMNQVNATILKGGDFTPFATNAIVADPTDPRQQRAEFRRRGPADVHLNQAGYLAVSRAFSSRFF